MIVKISSSDVYILIVARIEAVELVEYIDLKLGRLTILVNVLDDLQRHGLRSAQPDTSSQAFTH